MRKRGNEPALQRACRPSRSVKSSPATPAFASFRELDGRGRRGGNTRTEFARGGTRRAAPATGGPRARVAGHHRKYHRRGRAGDDLRLRRSPRRGVDGGCRGGGSGSLLVVF